jgi:hypothetical protein
MNGLAMVTMISVYFYTASHTPFLAGQVTLSTAEVRGNIATGTQFIRVQRKQAVHSHVRSWVTSTVCYSEKSQRRTNEMTLTACGRPHPPRGPRCTGRYSCIDDPSRSHVHLHEYGLASTSSGIRRTSKHTSGSKP